MAALAADTGAALEVSPVGAALHTHTHPNRC